MAINPYQQCPCGSGKQFKWCCQPYYNYVEKAEQLLQEKQVVAAGEIFAKLAQDHPQVPQVWMYQAEYLYGTEQIDAAETAIKKALELDPNFSMAHWFKGVIRENEGEYVGALILYRKAAENLHPEAKPRIGLIQSRIAELELGQNHPLAGYFALDLAIKALPQSAELRESQNRIFGDESHLPEIVCQPHALRTAPSTAQTAWQSAAEATEQGKLSQAASAYEKIATETPAAAAWFNLGLVRAWQGENRKAIDALNRSIDLDDGATATEAAVLVEVLRCGRGLENEADFVTHRAVIEIRDPDAVGSYLNQLGEQQRLVGLNADRESGIFNCLILEQTSKFGVSVGVPVARVASQLLIHQNQMLLWHSKREMLDQTIAEMREALNLAISQPEYELSAAEIANPMTDMLAFPTGAGVTPEMWESTRGDHLQKYFEDEWLFKPLKALAGISPHEAAAHPTYRKRLPGIILFLEQAVSHFGTPQEDGSRKPFYNFDRVRRKLGLISGAPVEAGKIDFDLLSVEVLGTLELNTLDEAQIANAFRAALRLDAPELASKFAKNATLRITIPDRYPFYNHLVKQAKEAGQMDDVLQLLKEGEAADEATNEGNRRGDYAISLGRILAQSGDLAKSAETFRLAISASPNNLNIYGPAAETMLGKKAGKDALTFAEQGLAKAREQNNRDAEQQFLELQAAAKKMV
jgi:tetratricopeptide (TPR) repeat protein